MRDLPFRCCCRSSSN